MLVLVVDGYATDHADAGVVDCAVAALQAKGHEVEHLALAADEYATFMTAAERRAYETDHPLLAAETQAGAAAVQRADAFLFCYPTTLFGAPPRLKSWLERVMGLGVAFDFDENHKVRPALNNIKHLGVITTSPHSLRQTWRARDLGRRTFMRALRLNCHRRCARTFVRVPAGSPKATNVAYLQRRLVRWR